MEQLQNYLPLFGILALLFVFYKNAWVSKQDAGNEKMQTIASNISSRWIKSLSCSVIYFTLPLNNLSKNIPVLADSL